MNINETFRKFAARIASMAGNPWAFIVAILLIVLWASSGPFFGFSNRWQLVINTGTTIVTLLMVFLIQNTQNRDSKAIHLKLDELLKGVKGARTKLIDIEELPDEILEELHEEFKKLQTGPYKDKDKKPEDKALFKVFVGKMVKTASRPFTNDK